MKSIPMLRNLDKIQQPYRDRVKEYIELLYKNFTENFISAIVFGSVARGEEKITDKYESDVDLLVVIDNLAERFSVQRLKQEIKVGIVYSVVPKFVTKYELEQYIKAKTGFILDAFAEGIIVYDKDNYFEERKKALFEELKQKGVFRKPNLGWVFPVKIGQRVKY